MSHTLLISNDSHLKDQAIWKLPFLVKFSIFFVFFFIIFGFLWGNFTHISGAVISNGEVKIKEFTHAVQHTNGGIVNNILVKNGEKITAGDPLFTLKNEVLLADRDLVEKDLIDLIAVESRIISELNGEDIIRMPKDDYYQSLSLDGLKKSIRAQSKILLANQKVQREVELLYRTKIDKINSQFGFVEKQISNSKNQLITLTKEKDDIINLRRQGHAKNSQVNSILTQISTVERSIINDEQSIKSLNSEKMALEQEIEAEHAKYLANLWKEYNNLQQRKINIQRQFSKLEQDISALVVTAPISGTIHNIQLEGIGSVLRANIAAMYIIPPESPSVVIAKIEPKDIDQAYVGQKAQIRILPFNSRSSNFIRGFVEQISEDTKIDPVTKKTYYEASVAMDLEDVTQQGNHLISGMPSQIFLETTPRTPASYLFRPITRYFQNIMID